MWAHFETISGLVRVFDDNSNWGDPYTWSATVRYLDNQTIEILGITQAPKPSQWRAIIILFATMGVKTIVYYRKQADGTDVEKRIRVKSKWKIIKKENYHGTGTNQNN